jgi:hypothetical protein
MLDFLWYLKRTASTQVSELWLLAWRHVAELLVWIEGTFVFSRYVSPFLDLATEYWAVPLILALIFYRAVLNAMVSMTVLVSLLVLFPVMAALFLPISLLIGAVRILSFFYRVATARRDKSTAVDQPTLSYQYDADLYRITVTPTLHLDIGHGRLPAISPSLKLPAASPYQTRLSPITGLERLAPDVSGSATRIFDIFRKADIPVLRDVYLQGTSNVARIDLLVATGDGLAVIEVRDWTGTAICAEIGSNWKISAPDGDIAVYRNPMTQNWVHAKTLRECFPGIKVLEMVVIVGDLRFESGKPQDVYTLAEAVALIQASIDPYTPFMGRVRRVFDVIKGQDKDILRVKFRLENDCA